METIGTNFLRNRICMSTEEPNQSVWYYQMLKVNDIAMQNIHNCSTIVENRKGFFFWQCKALIGLPDYPKGTHNADSIIKSKVIYYLKQCGLRV